MRDDTCYACVGSRRSGDLFCQRSSCVSLQFLSASWHDHVTNPVSRLVRLWAGDSGSSGWAPSTPRHEALSYRSDEVSTSPCLLQLQQRRAGELATEPTIEVAPLTDDDVRALCCERLASASVLPAGDGALIARVALEAQGSPFLIS